MNYEDESCVFVIFFVALVVNANSQIKLPNKVVLKIGINTQFAFLFVQTDEQFLPDPEKTAPLPTWVYF